jgi:hypothetical protein
VLDASIDLGPSGHFVHGAAAADAVGLLRFLIFERGVDPNQLDGGGGTALHAAIVEDKERAALFLVVEVVGSDLSARLPPCNGTPLVLAAGRGMLPVVKALVARGVDLEARAADEQVEHTALSLAVSEGREACALFLLEEAGAAWQRGVGTWSLLEAAAAGDCVHEQQQEQQGEDEDAILEAALAALSMPGYEPPVAAAIATATPAAMAGPSEDKQPAAVAPAAPAPAIEQQEEEEDDGNDAEALAAAIALSLARPPKHPPPLQEYLDAHAPELLLCPISLQLMEEPTLVVVDGCTYSRAAIEQHLEFCRQRACVCGCVLKCLVPDWDFPLVH